ncbi:MAG: TlpA family protein disulfide reductase [Alphaproteobacteria bacterium]|nr:TlpA family protein disulfide reductase [Alphaproteobacteria bacterium]
MVVVVWQALTPGPPTEGVAPQLTAPRVDGSDFDLAARKADAYVINFWATWCEPCRREIPAISRFAKAHPEVEVYGVSVDELAPIQLEAAALRLGIRYPVLHDARRDSANAWGVTTYPTTFVLDRHREVVAVRRGSIDDAALEEMLAKAR